MHLYINIERERLSIITLTKYIASRVALYLPTEQTHIKKMKINNYICIHIEYKGHLNRMDGLQCRVVFSNEQPHIKYIYLYL